MTLRLYYHPFSSYCQKVLVAFYERDVPFEREIVDLGDPAQRATLEALWPLAKFPLLRDGAEGLDLPESSVIVEYLDRAWPGAPPLIPADAGAALDVRLYDRFFDTYVMTPMQKIVADSLRPAGRADPQGVAEARHLLGRAYAIADARLAQAGTDWIAGDAFTLADCAAAPALFYANIVAPFTGHEQLEAYFQRLLARPSFARAVEEARPYRKLFPLEWPSRYA